MRYFMLESQKETVRWAEILGDNIKKDFKEIEQEGVDLIHLFQVMDNWRAVLSMTINLRSQYNTCDYILITDVCALIII